MDCEVLILRFLTVNGKIDPSCLGGCGQTMTGHDAILREFELRMGIMLSFTNAL